MSLKEMPTGQEDRAGLNLAEIPELSADRREAANGASAADRRPWAARQDDKAGVSGAQAQTFLDDGTDFRFRVRPRRKWFTLLALLASGVVVAGVLLSGRWRPGASPVDPPSKGVVATTERPSPDVAEPPAPRDTWDPAEVEDALSQAADDVEVYRDVLADYAEKAAGSSLGEAFQRVLDEDVPAMEPLKRCGRLLDRWATLDMRRMSSGDASRELAEAEPLLEQFPEMEAAATIRERCEVLRAITTRSDEGGAPIYRDILDDLDNEAYGLRFMLQTVDGRRYYLAKRPNNENDTFSFEYLTDLDATRKTTEVPGKEVDLSLCGLSPPTELAKEVRELLEDSAGLSWESTFFRLVVAVESIPRLDPLIKAQWMRRLLAVGCQGSHILEVAFSKQRELLDALPLAEDLNWLDPDDSRVEQVRQECIKALDSLPDLAASATAVAEKHKALKGLSDATKLVWVGRLTCDESGAWRCALAPDHAQYAGPAHLVCRSDSDRAFRILHVGEVAQGELIPNSTAEDPFREARPVYGSLPVAIATP